MLAGAEEALCRSVLFGSAINPNRCFILFAMAVVTCLRLVAEGFFFCCDCERLFRFGFSRLLLVASLLVPPAFRFWPVWGRGHHLEADRPHWFDVIRGFVCCDFFLFEAPRCPLVSKFFCGRECSSDSCNLLYFCSKDRYFLYRLSHSFLIKS